MSNEGKIPGCFKYGCVGCLSLGALVVALIFLASAVHLTVEPEDPRPEERQLSQDLPEVRYPPADAPQVPASVSLPEPPSSATGRVVVDLSMGEFIIQPGPAGEPIRVDADFDSSAFELREEYQQSADGGWTYELSFGSRRGFLGMLFGGGHQGNNRVELTIPRGQPIDIVGEIGLGESEIDLGGLSVRQVDLEFGAGDHFVEFRQPLPFPMDSFTVNSSVGEVEIRNLGEGSPRTVNVDHGIGELFVDLQGPWSRDATIDINVNIGEGRLWLPEGVRLDVEHAKVAIGESDVEWPDEDDLPADAPTLTLSMSGHIGEVSIRR